jgi:hypothetical protein
MDLLSLAPALRPQVSLSLSLSLSLCIVYYTLTHARTHTNRWRHVCVCIIYYTHTQTHTHTQVATFAGTFEKEAYSVGDKIPIRLVLEGSLMLPIRLSRSLLPL